MSVFNHSILSANPTTLCFGLLSTIYVAAYLQRKRSRLDRIPTMGYSGMITSWLTSVLTMVNGHHLVQEGYEKHRIFKISRYFTWLVLVNGPKYIDDIRKAEEDHLSFMTSIDEAGQFDYTVGPGLKSDTYHLNVVRGPMTRSIAERFPDLVDEMDKAFKDVLGGAENEWVGIPVYRSLVHIVSRVSARFFVGPKLSSDPKFTDTMQGFALHITKVGFIIRTLPTFLKALVSHAIFDSPAKIREVEEYLQPIVTERLQRKGSTHDSDAESNNMITWLLNSAQESQRNINDVAIRMVFLNFVAIHTTSALLTHVLFNLATYTSYIEPLREEISAVVQEGGWNKVAIEKMRKLDSFIKESQRLHDCDAIVMIRKVLRDFTFSDGTFVPKGANLAVTSRAINHDERYYPNPQEFQGFRFADQDPVKHQMTALTSEFMAFGLGRHACPGRFFAVTEIKTIVARLLLDYDIKLTDEQAGRPKNQWFIGMFTIPDRKAEVSLRKRRE